MEKARKNSWAAFLEYAKKHPESVPTSAKERAQMYNELMNKCKCGGYTQDMS